MRMAYPPLPAPTAIRRRAAAAGMASDVCELTVMRAYNTGTNSRDSAETVLSPALRQRNAGWHKGLTPMSHCLTGVAWDAETAGGSQHGLTQTVPVSVSHPGDALQYTPPALSHLGQSGTLFGTAKAKVFQEVTPGFGAVP